jgi:pilus assembly protein CpaD
MSSNRRAATTRILLVASIAALAAACASAPNPPPGERAGLTPTEQFSIAVASHPDQILLAPHAEGLSAAQMAALSALVERWRETGGGPIQVQAPSHGGGEAYRAASLVQAELGAMGVGEDRISLVGYDGGDKPGAPIVVGFDHFEAKAPVCGRNWDSFTSSMMNGPNNNFGCAVTANTAAMVANPADLAQAQPLTPGDAERREVVLGKYRQGQATSTAKDDQANGAISSVVH